MDFGKWFWGIYKMVTTIAESMQLIRILLRYISKKTAYKILNDMEIEVAKHTENVSLRDSIKMAKEYLKWVQKI